MSRFTQPVIRRTPVVLVGAATILALLLAGCSSSNAPSPQVESPREPSSTSMTARPTPASVTPRPFQCGDGFGPPADDAGMSDGRPVWSVAWSNGVSEMTTPWQGSDGSSWESTKAPVTVRANTAGTLRILEPKTARLVLMSSEEWTMAGDHILDAMADTVAFPACDRTDTYPGMLLVPAPLCVTLQVELQGGVPPYTAVVPVGRIECG